MTWRIFIHPRHPLSPRPPFYGLLGLHTGASGYDLGRSLVDFRDPDALAVVGVGGVLVARDAAGQRRVGNDGVLALEADGAAGALELRRQADD